MLETYRNNILACLMLSTSTGRGKFNVRATDKILYALAPLPYATGLFPLALREEIGMEFLPPVKDAVKMTFSERNKLGFKMDCAAASNSSSAWAVSRPMSATACLP